MKIFKKKSGHIRLDRKHIAKVYHESADKAGRHFANNFISRLENVHSVRLWVVEWVLLVVVVFLFAIVQNIWYTESYGTESFGDGGDYTEAVLGDINSMNPLYASTSAERTLGKLLFANLVSPDMTGSSRGDLAKTVRMNDEGTVWTLTLRDNLRWSDGEPITADDIIYTIDLIRDPTARTTMAVDFSRIKMKKKSNKVVEFTLPSPYIDFIDTLEFPVLPKHILGETSPALVYESDFSMNPVGSGPFVLKSLQVNAPTSLAKKTVFLSRNDNYFLSKTKLKSFTLKTYEKRDDIVSDLNASVVTATAELSGESSKGLSNKIEMRKSLLNGGVFAFFNTRSDAVSSRELRQAIQKGIDMNEVRAGISEAQYLDFPIIARQEEDLMFPEPIKQDKAAAKELFGKLEYYYDKKGKLLKKDGTPAILNVVAQKRDNLTAAAERFVGELNKLGFEANLTIYDESAESADFFSAVVRPREFDILLYEVDLGVSADPFVYYSSTQATAGGWNFSNYSNSLVDDALLSAHTTTNRSVRKTKYEYFLKAWQNDVPAIAFYQSAMDYYHVPNVQIYSESVILTDALDRFVDVRYWATARKTVNITP